MRDKLTKYAFLGALLIGLMIPNLSAYAQETPATDGGQSCAQANCTSATQSCLIGSTNGRLNVLSSQNSMNSGCLSQATSGGCFNAVPASCAGSMTGLGYRPNGAGGNSKPRNHLGTDIGAAACTQKYGNIEITVTAAAEGDVVYARTSGGGGRTIVINHDKACAMSSGTNGGYRTVYRHLLRYLVSEGAHVKKDQPIGIEGGSNASAAGASACDNPTQQGFQGWQRPSAACSAAASKYGTSNYAVHLHFEIADGKQSASAGSGISAAIAMSPNCNELQSLCGGCPTNSKSCGGAQGMAVGADGPGGSGAGTPGVAGGGASGGHSSSSSSIKDRVANMSAETQKALNDKCNLGEYLDSQNCTFCGIFKAMFNAASHMAKTAVDTLAGPSKSIVSIAFLIWLCFYILKQITNLGGTSTGEMLKGILYQGFRVGIVVIILGNAANIYDTMDLTLNPVMQTGLSFVQSLNQDSTCPEGAKYLQDIAGYEGTYRGSGTNADGGLSRELGKSILCSVKQLEDSTAFMMGLGKYSICLSFKDYSWLFGIVPHFGYLSTGIVLWLAGLFVLLTFPWCLVDCVLQLCAAAALIPCAIACYAFKVTEKYIKIIWNFFMNAMFNFVFMGLIIYIINSHLKEWIGLDIADSSSVDNKIFVTGWGENGIAWWGPNLLKILAICFFCNTFFEEAGDMAKKFAESPGLGGKNGIGRMVGGTVQNAAQSFGGATARLGVKGGKMVGAALNSKYGNSFRSGLNHAKGRVLGLLPQSKIRDENGKVIGYEKNIRLFGRDFNLKATKGEDGIWQTEKTTHKRSATDKAFEKVYNADGTVKKDANGNEVYRARQRIFGITTGYKEMVAQTNADGKLEYTTADGKNRFTMDDKGNIDSYKTRFTVNWDNTSGNPSLAGVKQGKLRRNAQGVLERQGIKQYGATRTVNDAFSSTKQTLDRNGNVIGSETKFKNVSSDYLVNKDGTINEFAFNQIKNGSQSAEVAASAMVSTVLQSRGQQLNSSYDSRNVKINDDGSFTINQVNTDGSTQTIHAEMVGNQMVIRNSVTDKNGNTTIIKSNGMQTKTEQYTRQYNKDTKKFSYAYKSNFSFSDDLHRKNSRMSPLDSTGRWGNNLDPTKVMAGFTDAEYQQHIAQIQLNNLKAQVLKQNKYAGEKIFRQMLNDPNSAAYQINAQLAVSGLSEGAARIHAGQALDDAMNIQLSQVNAMLGNRQQTLNDIQTGQQQAPAQDEFDRLQAEVQSLQQAQKDLRQILGLPDQPQPDQPQPDQPRPDQPRPDQPRPDQPRPDQPRPDQPRPDQPRPDQPRPDQPRPDQPRPDQPRPDQPRPDQPRPDQPRPDQPRPDQPRPNENPERERRRAEAEARRQAEEQRRIDERRAEEQRRAEERKAEEQRRAEEQRKADEERKAEEQRRAEEQRKAEEERKAEEQRRAEEQRKAEEKANAEAKQQAERHKEEFPQEKVAMDKEKAQLEKDRDTITEQYKEVEKQLAAAKAAMEVAGITPEEKQRAEAAYNALLAQSAQFKEVLDANRSAGNAAINDYNSRVEKHNSELGDNKQLK